MTAMTLPTIIDAATEAPTITGRFASLLVAALGQAVAVAVFIVFSAVVSASTAQTV